MQTTEAKHNINEKYKKVQIIGNGTFGCVFLARSTSKLHPEQQVAIKHVLQNKKYKNRQIQILKIVDNPNIVKLHEFYYEQKNNNTYLNLIMEYLPQTLSSVIKDNLYSKTFINDQLVIRYSYGLLKALVYLKSVNIAHRDVKPSNILLNEMGEAKLCDFGSAKVLVEGQKNISYICSRYYRSPELILGATQYTTAIDVWSLGCCIGEMMTNRPMFQGDSNNSLLMKIIRVIGSPSLDDMEAMKVEKKEIQKIQPLSLKERILKYNPAANLQVIELVEKMLVYDPNKRIKPEDALKQDIFNALREAQQNEVQNQKDNNNKQARGSEKQEQKQKQQQK